MAAAAGWGNTDGTGWATGRGWGNSHGHGWGNSSGWSDTTSEEAPTWDGVTRFPKTRGKKRHPNPTSTAVPSVEAWLCALPQHFSGLWHALRDVANKKLEDLPLPIAPLSLTVLFPAPPSERHGLAPFFLGFFFGFLAMHKKKKNERLPVLAIGSQAPEAALLVITTLLEGGGRHFDWNDVMDILSDQRLWLSPIDAGFIGPNEVTFWAMWALWTAYKYLGVVKYKCPTQF
ncbi:hypothetical protein B0H14DRAFT_2645961 [Mycena olivaceomarginata]|nr:hypothetical protein B0H14DRAFT_2645961 [Mycena olivaceomarginata]